MVLATGLVVLGALIIPAFGHDQPHPQPHDNDTTDPLAARTHPVRSPHSAV